jgi:CBS domain-containing protein
MSERKIFGIPVEMRPGRPLTSVFHRLSSVLPESQELLTVGPDMPAAEALKLMDEHGYSQVPIIHGGEVIGVFSYRSFSRGVAVAEYRTHPGTLPVSEISEKVPFARLNDEFQSVIAALNENDIVLVGDDTKLHAVVTAIDILQYLYDVASPYVLAAEIELGIRALISRCVDADGLLYCAKTSLGQFYEDGEIPKAVEGMTVNDYVQIIGDGRNWPKFETTFGGTRQSTRSKLERVRDLRNDLYHFKKSMTSDEYDELVGLREWLLLRVRLHQARGGK